MLASGTLLQDRYRVLRQIGGGGFGTVYLAEDTRLSGLYRAVKEMSPDRVPAEDRNWSISAFRQEAEILAHLQHPGVAAVTDFFPQEGNWYLVMEYVQGQTLADVLSAAPGGRLPDVQALNILDQLVEVLLYLHTQSPPVVFRDLKPGNVMITPEGKVKLIDFGIARFFKPTQGRDTVNLGTPGYAAPEQYGGQGQSDVRADVYGLGVLLHQMLTGHNPIHTPFRLPPVESLNRGAPPHVAQAVRQAIDNDPQARFPSVAHLQAALRGTSQTTTLREPAVSPPGGAPRWLGLVVGAGVALLLLAACAVGAFLVLNKKPASSPTPVARATRTLPPQPSVTVAPPPTVVVIVTATPGEEPGQSPVPVTVIVTATPEPVASPTNTPAPEITPSSLPAVAEIVYACGGVGNADVCVVNPQTGRAREIVSHSADDAEPDWRPDRGRIAFQSDRGGSYDIYVADADGRNAVNLSNTAGRDERGPDWSPTGAQIVYEVGDGRDNGELWVMNADGSNPHRLSNQVVLGRAPAWSPNGGSVAFMRQGSDGYWQIIVLDVSSGRETQLVHSGEQCRFPNWSPDGRTIVYNTYAALSPRGQTFEVWRVSADGGGPQRLTFDGDNGRPSWLRAEPQPEGSPDGGFIVYNHGDYLYVMDADGGSARRLSETFNGWAADW